MTGFMEHKERGKFQLSVKFMWFMSINIPIKKSNDIEDVFRYINTKVH